MPAAPKDFRAEGGRGAVAKNPQAVLWKERELNCSKSKNTVWRGIPGVYK